MDISDEIISTLGADDIAPPSNADGNETTVRKRNKNKPLKDAERTLVTPKGALDSKMVDGLSVKRTTNTSLSSKKSGAERNTNKGESKVSTASSGDKMALKVNGDIAKAASKEEGAEANGLDAEMWSQNQQVILEWALKQYPKTVDQRWEKIAEHIPGKNMVRIINDDDDVAVKMFILFERIFGKNLYFVSPTFGKARHGSHFSSGVDAINNCI